MEKEASLKIPRKERVSNVAFYPKHIATPNSIESWCREMAIAICKKHFLLIPKNLGYDADIYLYSWQEDPRSLRYDENSWEEGRLSMQFNPEDGTYTGDVSIQITGERCIHKGRIELTFSKKAKKNP